jgi:hypothetical protein
LKKSKYRLISEVNDIYGKDVFLDSLGKRTGTYKVAASIYKLFEYSSDSNPRDLLRCKNTLRESLTSRDFKRDDISELDNVTQGKVVDIMYEKFESKYSSLNSSQKEFLSNVASGGVDVDYLAEVVNRVESIITTELHKGSVSKDFAKNAISEVRSIDLINPDVNKLQLLVMLLGG